MDASTLPATPLVVEPDLLPRVALATGSQRPAPPASTGVLAPDGSTPRNGAAADTATPLPGTQVTPPGASPGTAPPTRAPAPSAGLDAAAPVRDPGAALPDPARRPGVGAVGAAASEQGGPPPSALEGLEGLALAHATRSPRSEPARPPTEAPAWLPGEASAESQQAAHPLPSLHAAPRTLRLDESPRARPAATSARGPWLAAQSQRAAESGPHQLQGAELRSFAPSLAGEQGAAQPPDPGMGPAGEAWAPGRPVNEAPPASASRAEAARVDSPLRPGEAETALAAARVLGAGSAPRSLPVFDTRAVDLKAVAAQRGTETLATRTRTSLSPAKLTGSTPVASGQAARARTAEASRPAPELEEKRRSRSEELLGAPSPAPTRPPVPLDLSVPAQQPLAAIPQAFEALLPQLIEDPSLRVALQGAQARVSVDTGDAGQLSLQLRVKDGVTEIRATGPAAPAMEARQNELRVALAGEGLALGHFDLTQSQSQQRQERPETPEPDPGSTQNHRPAAKGTEQPTAKGRVHVRA